MLDMKTGINGEDVLISSTFQVAEVSRPLWSVGRICDAGYTVVFDSGHAAMYHVESGAQAGVFSRKNGLYVGSLQLKNPSYKSEGFQRRDK